jgi:hypothetical protein
MQHAWGRGGEGRGVCRVLVVRPKGKNHWEDLGIDREDNIKMDLREIRADNAN